MCNITEKVENVPRLKKIRNFIVILVSGLPAGKDLNTECTVKSPKSMTFFIFSKATQWTGLESLPGRFWPPSHMFDTPDPNLISDKKTHKINN